MQRRGITSVGCYLPYLRLSRAAVAAAYRWRTQAPATPIAGARAIAAHDEDAITMAVEAARGALRDVEPLTQDQHQDQHLRSLYFASTSHPFMDRQNAAIVAEALNLAPNLGALDIAGSLNAGLGALRQALDSSGDALVVAADKRAAKPGSAQELNYGDGAAACVVGDSELIAEYLGGASLCVDMTHHYREQGAPFDYYLEERWVRDEGHLKIIPQTLEQALAATGLSASDIDHVAICGPSGATLNNILTQVGLPADSLAASIQQQTGDAGCASALLSLLHVLERARPGEYILLCGFAQGGECLVFRATDRVDRVAAQRPVSAALERGHASDDYVHYLATCELLDVDWGMRAEKDNRTAQSAFYRNRSAITGFVGGRCQSCDTVQFPPSRVCVNPDCAETDTQLPEPFSSRTGRIATYTHDWLAHAVNPPLMYGHVSFDGAGGVPMEFVDTQYTALKVGMPVRPVFRIKDKDELRHFRRYFWKASPIG